jgi:DUF4097 and DUF4098 domain-containing protein YvlB
MRTTSSEPAAARPRPPARTGVAVAAAVFAAVVVLLGVASVVGAVISVTEHARSSFSGVREVEVDTGSGDVEVTAADRADVRVEAITRRSWTRPELRQVVEAGVLRLSGGCRFVFTGECSVSYRIGLPRATVARLETGSGGVTVTGLRAAADARTGSGDVDVRDVSGAVGARTGSGNFSLVRVAGALRVRTGSGDIDGRSLTAATIEAHTGSGGIELVVAQPAPDRVLVSTGSGDVGLTVPDAVYRLNAHSDNGEVTTGELRQDPAGPHQIQVRTDSGDIAVRSG